MKKMRPRSFFTKLFLGNLLLIGIIVAIAGVVSYHRLNESYIREGERHQEAMVAVAQRHMERLWSDQPNALDTFDTACRGLLAGSGLRLTVIAADGRVLGDNQADPRTMANHRTDDRPEIVAALRAEPGRSIRRSETVGVQFRYLALPLRHDGQVVGVVRVAMPVVAVAESTTFIRNALLWSAASAVGAAVALALMLSWMWYAPLRQVTRTARTLAGGDLSRRAAITGPDELAQLGAALNEMRDNISRQIAQIAAQQENLVAVVENLREGVIALDSDGQVILMNPAAVQLLASEAEDIPGKHLQAVVRVPDIVDVYNELDRERKPLVRQIEAEIKGKRLVLEVHAVLLDEESAENLAALLVVRDITDLVRMAAVKAEFVANASHELRTPLATIRAAVDSLTALKPAAAEEVEHLGRILDRHTTRLEEMTNDLLSLHLVESTRQRLRLETIDLGGLAAWVRDHFTQRAEEKGVRLIAEAADPLDEVRSDATLVQLILQNLLDNAIKFTPAGGEVVSRFDTVDDRVMISVRDTGCGIPAEIQDRVFERFYQADASRSGEPRIRGTGLGLAIVKHAAERLGAFVKLQSQVDRGTTVTVTIPRDGPPA